MTKVLGFALALSACTEPHFDESRGEPASGPVDGEAEAGAFMEMEPDAGATAVEPELDAGETLEDDARARGSRDAYVGPARDAQGVEASANQEGGASKCSLGGTFSVRSDMLVTWAGKTFAGFQLVRPGSGEAQVFARVIIAPGTERKLRSEVTLCGANLPEFLAGDAIFFKEAYGFYLNDEIWDRSSMPRWQLPWASTCAEPGCTLVSEVLEAPVGANAYVDAPAPIETKDHDGDGNAGVTVTARGPSELSSAQQPYSLVPLSAISEARSEHLFAVVLFKAQFNATYRDCDRLSGNSNQTRITLRTAGCLARNTRNATEVPCSADQTKFVADNIPDVSVSSGATLEMRRVADGADCAAIRAAWK